MLADALKAKIKVCMFDQYGTVVDMQKGLTEVVTPYLQEKGWHGRPDAFVTWWRRTHFENSMIDALLHREHTPYREIGHRAVAYTLERAGISYTMDDVRYLVAQIERLKPFPDVPAALARLKTRYKIVVLSNGDPDMLEAAKAFHGIPFDAVISVAKFSPFGHPHPDALARLQTTNARVWRTSECGAITISTNGNDLRVETFVKCESGGRSGDTASRSSLER